MKMIFLRNSYARFCVLLCLFVVTPAFTVNAELEWEQKTIQLDLHPLQITGTVAFSFKNNGTNAVEILAARTTCGCLKASASTNLVAVGESGTIDVVYNFSDKLGPQRKSVAVRIRDASPKMLYVQTTIPEVYTLSSKRLEWASGSALSAQTCRLVNHLKEPVILVSAVSSSDLFNVELIPVRDGFEYKVRVTPDASASKQLATITVQTECPPELSKSRSYTITAVVR